MSEKERHKLRRNLSSTDANAGGRVAHRRGAEVVRAAARLAARNTPHEGDSEPNPGHNLETPDTPYLQTLDGPFSAVSKPNLATEAPLERA